ncbi:MAG: MarR family winged helix-turn-helix transcriptional regulator [Gaiellales bacterium]
MSSAPADQPPDARAESAVWELQVLLPRLSIGYKHSVRSAGRQEGNLREAFARAGLGPRHAHVLLQLGVHGEQSVTQLAERLQVTRTTASLMVAELSRAGITTRREDDADHRRRLVGIADGYREGVEKALARCAQPLRRAVAAMSADEAVRVVDGIRSLVEELEAADETEGPGECAADR